MVDLEIYALVIAFGVVPLGLATKGYFLAFRESEHPPNGVEQSIESGVLGLLLLCVAPTALWPSTSVFLVTVYIALGLFLLGKDFRTYVLSKTWLKKMFALYVALQAAYLTWLHGGLVPSAVSVLGLPGLFAIATRRFFQRELAAANKQPKPTPYRRGLP